MAVSHNNLFFSPYEKHGIEMPLETRSRQFLF